MKTRPRRTMHWLVESIHDNYLFGTFGRSGFSILLLVLLQAIGCSQVPPATNTSETLSGPEFYQWAATPPMGWNSWDCFGAAVTEEQTMQNAEYMEKNLKSHGWNIVTIDIQWYEPLARGSSYRRGAVSGNGC